MKLHIENFAKIKNAELTIDGITVIAGENDTGKSTVGRILFSLFNSLHDIEEKINLQRLNEVTQVCAFSLSLTRSEESLDLIPYRTRMTNKIRRYVSGLLKDESNIDIEMIHEAIYDILQEELNRKKIFLSIYELQNDELKNDLNILAERIHELLQVPNDIIERKILTAYFNGLFSNQINSLVSQDCEARITTQIKGKNIHLVFNKNVCTDLYSDVSIGHQAIYIDNPFIIDNLSSIDLWGSTDKHLSDLLTAEKRSEVMDGIIGSILLEEKLASITGVIQSVVQGEIIKDKENELYLKKQGWNTPISVHNLSTGLKSFVILKMLIEKGSIKEKDVLILDEPEIHLHPQWQLTYAELIVLLQKQFDLSIIVTTHSPYFLEAIDLYSRKHETDSKVHYYLSEIDDNSVTLNDVTGNLEGIYRKMASPLSKLKELRYELNNV